MTATTARKTNAAATEAAQPFHFFASTAFAWAVAPTRREAIAKVARASGADAIKGNVKAHGGLYVWTCRVDVPQAQSYAIESYAPKGVPCAAACEYDILDAKGGVAPRESNGVTLSRGTIDEVLRQLSAVRNAVITGACNVRHTATKELLDGAREELAQAVASLKRAAGAEG